MFVHFRNRLPGKPRRSRPVESRGTCRPGEDGAEPSGGLAVSDGQQALRVRRAREAPVVETRLRPGFLSLTSHRAASASATASAPAA